MDINKMKELAGIEKGPVDKSQLTEEQKQLRELAGITESNAGDSVLAQEQEIQGSENPGDLDTYVSMPAEHAQDKMWQRREEREDSLTDNDGAYSPMGYMTEADKKEKVYYDDEEEEERDESVAGLDNGYEDSQQNQGGTHTDDRGRFPKAQTREPAKKLGTSAGKTSGTNPMATESAYEDVREELVYKYRKFLEEYDEEYDDDYSSYDNEYEYEEDRPEEAASRLHVWIMNDEGAYSHVLDLIDESNNIEEFSSYLEEFIAMLFPDGVTPGGDSLDKIDTAQLADLIAQSEGHEFDNVYESKSRIRDFNYGYILENFNSLKGQINELDAEDTELKSAISKLDAAKRGLQIVGKMKPGEERAKHTKRVMSNLNKIRGLVQRLANSGTDETKTYEATSEIGFTIDDVEIKDGTITLDGRKVGRAEKDFKHGYHPVIVATAGDQRKEFEMDTPDLIKAVKEWVASVY